MLREFSYLALYSTDGHAEVITGEPLSINDEAAFLHALNKGEKSVVSALTSSGKKFIILGISVGYPVSRGYPMKDGRICTALVVGQPLESISDAMSLNLDESQVYSQIIRKTAVLCSEMLLSKKATIIHGLRRTHALKARRRRRC